MYQKSQSTVVKTQLLHVKSLEFYFFLKTVRTPQQIKWIQIANKHYILIKSKHAAATINFIILGVNSTSVAVINCSLMQEIYEFEYHRNIIRKILSSYRNKSTRKAYLSNEFP